MSSETVGPSAPYGLDADDRDDRGSVVPDPPVNWGAVLLGSVTGIGIALLQIEVADVYGVSVFLLAPFVMGLTAAFWQSAFQSSTLMRDFKAAVLTPVVGSLAFLALGGEGLICILMALPHVIGAPQPAEHASAAPEELGRQFVLASLLASFVFWVVLGGCAGYFQRRFSRAASG